MIRMHPTTITNFMTNDKKHDIILIMTGISEIQR